MSDAARRNVLVDTATLLAVLAGAVLVCRSAHAAPSPSTAAYVVVLVVVVRVLSLGVHELGHLVFAALAGWRWDVYKMGPLLISREGDRVSVTLRGGRRYRAAGLALTHPPSPELDTRGRHILMLSGGPAASVLLALLAAAASGAVAGPFVRVALGITAVYSAIVCVTTLLPFMSAGNPSDGATILELFRERNSERPRHAR